MLGHASLGSRALGSLPNASMPAVAVTMETVVEARFDHPLLELTGDPDAMLVWSVAAQATELGSGAEDETIYAATLGFITRTTDDPANQPFAPTLDASITVRRSVIGQDGFTGYAQSVSEIVFNNGGADYDTFGDGYSINGKPIECRVGRIDKDTGVVAAYAQFETVANLVGDRTRLSRAQMIVESRDLQSRLDVPVQPSTYVGNGELEGGAEIKGLRRPYGDGVVFNATPTNVWPARGLFQYSTGATASLDAVRDGGIELTLVGDYATAALLLAAEAAGDIDPGSYASSVAEGYFCIGGVAVKQITCDFTGLRTTTADIIEQVALNAGGLTAAEIDAWTFEKLNDDQPAQVGCYLDSQSNETCNDLFARLMEGIGGYHAISTLGRLQVRRIDAPVGIAADYYELGGAPGVLVDVDRADMPAGLDPPPRRQRVVHGRNYTQQTELFGQVSEEDPDFANELGQPYTLASSPDSDADAVLADYPHAPDPNPVEAYFANAADARAEAVRRHALYTSNLKCFQLELKHRLFFHQIGEEIAIKDGGASPRLGLSSWRYVRILEIDDDVSSGTTRMIVIG